jgi:hypothetical protein
MVRGIYMQLGEGQQVVRGTLQGEASGFKLAVMAPRLAYYTPTFETYQGGTLLVAVAKAERGPNNNSLDPASSPSGLPPSMLQDPLFKGACRSSNIRLHELLYAHDVAVEVAQVIRKKHEKCSHSMAKNWTFVHTENIKKESRRSACMCEPVCIGLVQLNTTNYRSRRSASRGSSQSTNTQPR